MIQVRENNTFILGTHWTYEIVNMLLRNTTELDNKSKMQSMLEAVEDLSVLEGVPSPRIMDTHCLFKYLPKQHKEKKVKIVHMIRNPKDVCVSYYYHCLKDMFINFDGTWEEFFELFMSGKREYFILLNVFVVNITFHQNNVHDELPCNFIVLE